MSFRAFPVTSSDIAACPEHRLDPGHYRVDGSCKCGPHPMTGRRVRLEYCSDPWTRLAEGTEGTVGLVDDMGTWHVNWDDGGQLGLIPGVDRWRVLPEGGG